MEHTAPLIRAAGRADIPAVLELYRYLNSDAPADPDVALANWEALKRYRGSEILLAHAGGVPVSTCTLVVIPNLTRHGAPYALIENVVTHIDHRGRGYGRAVLHAAAETAWRCGCYKVMLMTGSTDPGTLIFYANAGFAQSKTGFQMRRPAQAPAV